MSWSPYKGPCYENPDHQSYFERLLKKQEKNLMQDKGLCQICNSELIPEGKCGYCPVCGDSSCG